MAGGLQKYFYLFGLKMQALTGGDWLNKVEKFGYQHPVKLQQRESERPIDDHKDFQESLSSKFHITNIKDKKTSKSFTINLDIDKRHFQAELFIYEFASMKGTVIAKKPVFTYMISSIYKVPLSEKQFTNWIFHSCFNTLQAQNLYISVDHAQNGPSEKLVIQMSQYQSDVINQLCGEKRLTTAYWKPTIVEKVEVTERVQVSLFDFIEKMAKEALNTPKICIYTDRKELSRRIFDLLANPLNFLDSREMAYFKVDLKKYFLDKPKATFNEKQEDVEIQYNHLERSGQDSLHVTIYFYDFKESKLIFETQSLLFSFQRLSVFKKPLTEIQRTSLIFKQLFIVFHCPGFVLSLQPSQEELYIQIAKQQQMILDKFRGETRFQSTYWKCIEQNTVELNQKRVYSFEKLVKVVEQNFQKSSIFGSWKASNNTALNIFKAALK